MTVGIGALREYASPREYLSRLASRGQQDTGHLRSTLSWQLGCGEHRWCCTRCLPPRGGLAVYACSTNMLPRVGAWVCVCVCSLACQPGRLEARGGPVDVPRGPDVPASLRGRPGSSCVVSGHVCYGLEGHVAWVVTLPATHGPVTDSGGIPHKSVFGTVHGLLVSESLRESARWELGVVAAGSITQSRPSSAIDRSSPYPRCPSYDTPLLMRRRPRRAAWLDVCPGV